MAEAQIDLQASNVFGLSANFNTQSSSTTEAEQNAASNDESGNVACQRNFHRQIDVTQNAKYCGFDFVTDLGTFLTEFGNVQSGYVVTQLVINMSAGDYCTLDITGHQHVGNTHVAGLEVGYADVSDFLPHEAAESFLNWDGFGVPNFNVSIGADASPSSATVTFTMNHVDTNGEDGEHLVGRNITPRCELTMDFEGTPEDSTASDLETAFASNTNEMYLPLVDSTAKSDSNSEFDTFSLAAHANVDLATV